MKSVIHVGTNGLTLSGMAVEGPAGVCGAILMSDAKLFVIVISRTGGSTSWTGTGMPACVYQFVNVLSLFCVALGE